MHSFRRVYRAVVGSLCLAAFGLLTGCASLPSLQGRTESHAIEPDPATPLGRAVMPLAQGHPGKTGFVAIDDGRLAFETRLHLARSAARSIDVQTYIWHNDATGTLLFEEVARAAERGVRVRLLLDDANTVGLDPTLALLASQPNIELRLYNPFVGPELARARASGRLRAAQSPDAQQVVHGRQPRHRGRRPQHRRRILRGGAGNRPGRSRCAGDRRGGAPGVDGVRPVLEQPVGVSRGLAPGRRGSRGAPGARASCSGSRGGPAVRGVCRRDPAHEAGERACSKARSPSNGRPPGSFTTIRRRRWRRAARSSCSSCRRSRLPSARPRPRST